MSLIKKFDFVWASHVIEHTIRPDIVFKKIYHTLNSGGYFFVEVPNCIHKPTLESSINDNPSTFHFSRKALIELGKRSGFNLIKSNIFYPYSSIKTKIKKIFLKKSSNSNLIYDRFVEINENKGINLRAIFQK